MSGFIILLRKQVKLAPPYCLQPAVALGAARSEGQQLPAKPSDSFHKVKMSITGNNSESMLLCLRRYPNIVPRNRPSEFFQILPDFCVAYRGAHIDRQCWDIQLQISELALLFISMTGCLDSKPILSKHNRR
jgi:hypothetical protein